MLSSRGKYANSCHAGQLFAKNDEHVLLLEPLDRNFKALILSLVLEVPSRRAASTHLRGRSPLRFPEVISPTYLFSCILCVKSLSTMDCSAVPPHIDARSIATKGRYKIADQHQSVQKPISGIPDTFLMPLFRKRGQERKRSKRQKWTGKSPRPTGALNVVFYSN